MSARPATLQLLKAGKLLCSAVFPSIVETWNWLVEAFDGLKGDYDLNPQEGSITVDRTDPAHPVIRLAKPVKAESSPSPSGGDNESAAFRYDQESHIVGAGAIALGRRYYRVDAMTSPVTDGSVMLHVVYTGSAAGAHVVTLESGDAFSATPDNENGYIPLYDIASGKVVHDYRAIPVHLIRE